MNAPLTHPIKGQRLADPQTVFAERCEARALLVINGALAMHEAVDELQAYAELSGLIGRIGQDEAQEIMGAAFMRAEMLPDDDGLDEACEREIMLATADLVRRWELEDPRDRWRHTGEAPPKPQRQRQAPKAYQPPECTVQAFWFVVGLSDPARLKAWLVDHPHDRLHLLKLLEAK